MKMHIPFSALAIAALIAICGCDSTTVASSGASSGTSSDTVSPNAASSVKVVAGTPAAANAQPSTDNPKPAAAGNKPAPAEVKHQAPMQVASGGDGRARNITFDALKFPMEDPKSRTFERSMLTESIEKLNGTRVRVRGFILPGALEEFSTFVLVRDNQECCFGPGSALYDSVMVAMDNRATTQFVTRPVTVEGTFEVKELQDPRTKKYWSIYSLKATKVE